MQCVLWSTAIGWEEHMAVFEISWKVVRHMSMCDLILEERGGLITFW